MAEAFCSEISWQMNEVLYGTGGTYGIYLLIEWNNPWPEQAEQAFINQEFTGEAGERWQAMIHSLPTPRVQLITRQESTPGQAVTVYIAIPHEMNPLLYEFQLESYHGILDLDMPGLLTGEIDYHHFLRDEPLFLVCTNGKRDACCARNGLPVYHAMLPLGGDNVWQSSHIAGHRFAGTMICMPHGLYYGRLTPNDAAKIIESYRQGQITLENYRGRACYDRLEQVGEYFLRQQTGLTGLDAFRLLEHETPQENTAVLTFEALADSAHHRLTITQALTDWQTPVSCGDDKREARFTYSLADYHVTQPQS